MFGMPMQVVGKELTIEMKPPSREEVAAMAPYLGEPVARYLLMRSGQTAQTEAEWYDSVVKSQDHTMWGIFVGDETGLLHVGNTSLVKHGDFTTSGVLVHRKEYWGKGIVSLAHLARTFYASEVMDLPMIRSEVYQENVASRRALEKVGYVHTGTSYGRGFIQGRVQHADLFHWVNPSERSWNYFWGDTKPPEEFAVAREKAQTALGKAHELVKFV